MAECTWWLIKIALALNEVVDMVGDSGDLELWLRLWCRV